MSKVLDKPTPSASKLSKKYGKSMSKEIKKGEKVEQEHTSNKKTAREIARDHIGENPHYYEKLNKAKLEEEKDKAKKKKAPPYSGPKHPFNVRPFDVRPFKEETINEISPELAQRYIQKAQATAHVGIQGWLPEDPKAPFKKFNRVQGVWRAAQRGGWPKQGDASDPNTDWRTGEIIKKDPPKEEPKAKPLRRKRVTKLTPAQAEKEILRRSKAKKRKLEEMDLHEISAALAQRYYDKAMTKDFSREHQGSENPLGKHRELGRLIGVNRAIKRGAKADWKPMDYERPKEVNSLDHIMRKRIKPYVPVKSQDVMSKTATREKTGFGRERLVKALKALKGKAEAQSYTPRLATPRIRQPDLFDQGPHYPGDDEIIKAMAGRQRTLSKIERVTSRLNQYGEKSPHPRHQAKKTTTGLSTRQISQSKSFATHQQVGKNKSPAFAKWYPGQKMKSGYATDKKEETTMDNKDLIREAINSILDNKMIEMRDYFNEVLEEKTIEKLDEAKRQIASSFFATSDEE